MKPYHIIAVSIVGTFSIFLSSCSRGGDKEARTTHQKTKIPEVEIIWPMKNRPTYTLVLPGELKPYDQADLFAKAKGFVKTLLVDRGSKVKKGQLLAILEAPEISQQYISVQSDQRKLYEDYLYSKQVFERIKRAAMKQGSIAEIELDKAKASFRSDSSAYLAAKAKSGASAQLEKYLKIVSPFNGTIVSRNISVGALVGENNSLPLFTVAQQEHLRLTVAIPEKHSHSINKLTPVTFTVSNYPGRVFKSSLSRNTRLLDPQSRSIMTEFDVNNSSETLNGGEFAQVKLTLQRSDSTLWVPLSVVVRSQSGIFIQKIENGEVNAYPR